MRYYIIAGEASGDLHGGNLVRALSEKDPGPAFRGWGGDLMQAAGVDVVRHYRDLAFMGFVGVLSHLPQIFANLRFCKRDILEWKPDALILVDYPGFNLRIAEWAHRRGFRVIYYISPQVWAWKESRVRKIRKCVDLMLVILPFEQAFYNRWNYPVEYVGHPLVQVIERAQPAPQDRLIALLPGSRRHEVERQLPVMLEVARRFPDYQFVVAQAPGLEDGLFATGAANVEVTKGNTYGLLQRASAALVTSGTATLETALFGVPQVVCYKGDRISYEIARRLIRVPYISLVNLIMNKPVVRELIQNDLTPDNAEAELRKVLENQEERNRILADYAELKRLLSQGGDASANAAGKVLDYLSE